MCASIVPGSMDRRITAQENTRDPIPKITKEKRAGVCLKW
jgi:hypothetical protein